MGKKPIIIIIGNDYWVLNMWHFVLNTLNVLIHSIFRKTPWNACFYYANFTCGEDFSRFLYITQLLWEELGFATWEVWPTYPLSRMAR